MRILLVDDNSDHRTLMHRAIAGLDQVEAVDTATSGDEALAILRQGGYDVVLLDHGLPDRDGMSVLQDIVRRGIPVEVIMVTGEGSEQVAVNALKLGAADYLVKSGNYLKLLPATVEQAIERHRRDAERKQLEEQLRHAQKMEAIGRLAGGIAHDFNNVLTAIIGFSRLLQKQIPEEDPQRRYVDQITKAGDRAATLTRQLLAFSRQQMLTAEVVDLVESISSIETMLRPLIGEDVELITNVDPMVGRVMADPGQIEQVIINLAVNARDAMPQGGRLTIAATNVELDEVYSRSQVDVRPGPYVMIRVSDTGTGIDDETRSRMFEPFFTTKERGKGTGLGLSTVYGIVKQSGGHVEVETSLGRGTTFRIYLPRVEALGNESGEILEAPSADSHGSETILLIEDQEDVRSLVVGVLEGNGYTVIEASRGDEAIALAEAYAGPIHLLLTDIVTPGMSGQEVAEDLAEKRPELKVLYISGYTGEAISRRGVLDRGIALLQKPFTPELLVQRVRAVLDAPAARSRWNRLGTSDPR